jgi:hypothetical protein
VTSADPLAHPAVAAWRRLGGAVPDDVQALVTHVRSAVYRLTGARGDAGSVIAKRSPLAHATVEQTVYAQVLPHVPVSSPRFYGLAPDADGSAWLFLEDVGDERFTPQSQPHRVLAARWLGRLHATAAGLEVSDRLPDHGPAHHLDHLRAGRDAIRRRLQHPATTSAERDVLTEVAAQCDALEAGWGDIARVCAEMPPTVVHGDFRAKNIRVRALGGGPAVFPLDWETAGWGVPATDLGPSRGPASAVQVDLRTYAAVTRDWWPGLDAETLVEIVGVGAVFRRLVAISWESRALATPWPQKAVASMAVYRDDLRRLARTRTSYEG